VCRLEDEVPSHGRVHNLASHVLVRDPRNHAVLLGVVLVLVLEDKSVRNEDVLVSVSE
jgi:hypothetical protein